MPRAWPAAISSGKVLNAVAPSSSLADRRRGRPGPFDHDLLTFDEAGDSRPDNYGGRNFHFGIREHGMAAAVNGMALSMLRPYGATFFVFTDYMRPVDPLSAIMQLPSIYIFTHDSIGVGEDGPTHQPIEHLAALRAIPHLVTMRPGDANEVSEAYRSILPHKHQPVALILSRQNLPTLDRTKYAPARRGQGGYVLGDAPDGQPQVILIGTGSELQYAVEAYEKLKQEGISARVVSMPSWELFEAQDQAYRDQVLPPAVKARVAVEAGIRQGWDRYIGVEGEFVGMSSFGASAPAPALYKYFGITTENVVSHAKKALGQV